MKKKSGDDFMKKMVIVTFALLFGYLAWCWIAKIIWGLDPPEGCTIAALTTAASELLGCSVMQAVKTWSKRRDMEDENEALRAELEALKEAMQAPAPKKRATAAKTPKPDYAAMGLRFAEFLEQAAGGDDGQQTFLT